MKGGINHKNHHSCLTLARYATLAVLSSSQLLNNNLFEYEAT